MPPDISGGGEIVLRQTTYWELQTATSRVRVYFDKKAETRYSTRVFSSALVTDSHPVLTHYHETWADLYPTQAASNPAELASLLDALIQKLSGGFRELNAYKNPCMSAEAILQCGHGLLLQGPSSVVDAAASALDQAGLPSSILRWTSARPQRKVLLMDDSFVVAQGFAFRRLPT